MPKDTNTSFSTDVIGQGMQRLADTDHSISPAAYEKLVERIREAVSWGDEEKLRKASVKLYKQTIQELTHAEAQALFDDDDDVLPSKDKSGPPTQKTPLSKTMIEPEPASVSAKDTPPVMELPPGPNTPLSLIHISEPTRPY